MKIIILGSGIIGITTAYNLAANGHEVEVIDRMPEPAMGCSFANGGQLSYSHAEPWASPAILAQIPKWLMDKNSPLKIVLQKDPDMWKWFWQFLLSCRTRKTKYNSQNIMRLSLYSKRCLARLEQETDITYSQSKNGILHHFQDEKLMQLNIAQAKFQKALGCDFEILEGRKACTEKEPALRYCPQEIIGGIYFPLDQSGDANEFARNLSAICKEKGVNFHYNTKIKKLAKYGAHIQHVETDKGIFTADAYVVALGSSSPAFLGQIGINIPVYPMKGYSLSIPITNPDAAPEMGITDQRNRIVFSRFGNILRVAGTAEFSGHNDNIEQKRIATLRKMAKQNFPACGDIDSAKPWAGLRPATPDGSPVIGRSPFDNLFLNTGHGTLGWTLSCGSAKIISDMIDGKKPEITLGGLTIDRFI